jgi:soluble lytic murein transglycosylase
MKRFNHLLIACLGGVILGGAVALWQWQLFSRSAETKYDHLIQPIAAKEGVDPLLVRAVIWRESRFDPLATGAAKERGLMQVTPIAAEEWVRGDKVENFTLDQLFDPETNIRAGTWYLGRALRRWRETDQPILFALAEYNAGRSRALQWVDSSDPASSFKFVEKIDFPTTRAYLLVIQEKHEQYRLGRFSSPWELLWQRVKRRLGSV